MIKIMMDAGAMVDDGMVYWDVRPSANFPTVEVRVADVPSGVGEQRAAHIADAPGELFEHIFEGVLDVMFGLPIARHVLSPGSMIWGLGLAVADRAVVRRRPQPF